MKIAIVGSRRFQDYQFIEKKMFEVLMELNTTMDRVMIVSGGAKGVDTLAQEFAKKHGRPILIFYPDWKRFGKRAALIRNEKIVRTADVVVAFPDEKSRGTRHVIGLAEKEGKKLFVFEVEVREREFNKKASAFMLV